MCLKTLERQQLTRAPLCFTFKSTHEHDELNWPTKSAKGFREATTEDAKICATPLWLTVSGSQAFTYRCEQTQKGDHFEFLTDLSALVPYPTVRTTWSSFVPQEAANTLVEMTGQPHWRWTRVVVTRLCIPWRFSGRAQKRDRLGVSLDSRPLVIAQERIAGLLNSTKPGLSSRNGTRSRTLLNQEVQRGPPRASDYPLASGN